MSARGCGCCVQPSIGPPKPPEMPLLKPAGCKPHLTCQPVHPPRPADNPAWFDHMTDGIPTFLAVVAGLGLLAGGCVMCKTIIDKRRAARKAALNQRLTDEGRRADEGGDEDNQSGSEDGSDNDDLRLREG